MTPKIFRSTLIVHGRFAMREKRLEAARQSRHGLQIMTFEQAASRLAGGFTQPIDPEVLRAVICEVLPDTAMGELERIKLLPGMVSAAADTLRKVWRSDINLSSRAEAHPRLAALARLEQAVLAKLPPSMKRPIDIVTNARARLVHAPAVLGPMEIMGLTELSPCWRPLLHDLSAHIPVKWTAGPRYVPDWLTNTGVEVEHDNPREPAIACSSAATAYHEAIEAMRWMRSLLASGRAAPHEIAIATTSPAVYDNYFLALRRDAHIDLHFAHGIPVVTTRDGQAAAALADVLVRGLNQSRLRRLVALCKDAEALRDLPDGWLRILPADAPLSTNGSWDRFLEGLTAERWPDNADHTPALRNAIALLAKGIDAAAEIGEAFLAGRALSIWRQALVAGPPSSLDLTLEQLRQDDGLEGCVSVAFMPANALAASPRKFVRLLGLNSSRWPRGISEDRLIPNHIIPTRELDPLPVSLADRRDFETILATTSGEFSLSRARRDSDGRLLGRSPLLARFADETYLRRNAVPVHAFSETDRLLARPQEFRKEPQAVSAQRCWTNWRSSMLTPHDGVVRANHPVLLQILGRTHSASSLKRLLRNPLGFVWTYAFGWKAPESSLEPLTLDPLAFGDLVHRVLDQALQDLESAGGFASAGATEIRQAVARAVELVAASWEGEQATPPALIWKRTLSEVELLATNALTYPAGRLPDARSYSEVPFGGMKPNSNGALPWDPNQQVTIPGAGFRIAGYIDRLDVTKNGRKAAVCDYKTGKPPKDAIRLNGGKELQRCLYAFAVNALLGGKVEISASLLYPRDAVYLLLEDAEDALAELTTYLSAAKASLTAGHALPGPDTGDAYDDLAFALPANAPATYCKRKLVLSAETLSDLAPLWEAV